MSMKKKVGEGVRLAICPQNEVVGTLVVHDPVSQTVNIVDVCLKDVVGAHEVQRPSSILIAVCFSVIYVR
jgi:hypothetical protein